jgi:hypothetical protein
MPMTQWGRVTQPGQMVRHVEAGIAANVNRRRFSRLGNLSQQSSAKTVQMIFEKVDAAIGFAIVN